VIRFAGWSGLLLVQRNSYI